MDEPGVEGLIITPTDHYFVEPARKYSKAATTTDYVIYRESDVVTNSGAECGVTLSEKVTQKVEEISTPTPQQVSAPRLREKSRAHARITQRKRRSRLRYKTDTSGSVLKRISRGIACLTDGGSTFIRFLVQLARR